MMKCLIVFLALVAIVCAELDVIPHYSKHGHGHGVSTRYFRKAQGHLGYGFGGLGYGGIGLGYGAGLGYGGLGLGYSAGLGYNAGIGYGAGLGYGGYGADLGGLGLL